MADNGIVWNIYLDKLPKGKHKINKLFPTEKIVGIADKYSKIGIIISILSIFHPLLLI